MDQRDYQLIAKRLNRLNEVKWNQLCDRHFSLIPSLFKFAERNDRLYFTILLHLNCVFEGGLKLLGEKKGLSLAQLGRLDDIIGGLRHKGIITDSVERRLRAYKDNYRNKYTHEVFQTPGKMEAIDAVTETYFLTLVLISLYTYSAEITDVELDRATIQSFCESLSLYMSMHKLFTKHGRYVVPIGIDELRIEVLNAYRDSLFSKIFSLELVETRGLGHPFRLRFIDRGRTIGSEWRLRVDRLSDYPGPALEPHSADIGLPNVFYLLFRFTRRSRVERYAQELSSFHIPNFVLDVLRENRRLAILHKAAKDYLLLDNWMPSPQLIKRKVN